jgi:hypothetical protein
MTAPCAIVAAWARLRLCNVNPSAPAPIPKRWTNTGGAKSTATTSPPTSKAAAALEAFFVLKALTAVLYSTVLIFPEWSTAICWRIEHFRRTSLCNE